MAEYFRTFGETFERHREILDYSRQGVCRKYGLVGLLVGSLDEASHLYGFGIPQGR